MLSLALGPAAAELCRSWCHPAAAVASCEHATPLSTSLTAGDDTCGGVGMLIAVLQKDGLRILPSPDARAALTLQGEYVPAGASAGALRHLASPSPPLFYRPLFTVLRI